MPYSIKDLKIFIRCKMKERKVSQAAMARGLDYDRTYVNHALSDKCRVPKMGLLGKMLKSLGFTLSEKTTYEVTKDEL